MQELNRVFGNGHEAVTYLDGKQLICLIEKDGKTIIKNELNSTTLRFTHPFGSVSLSLGSVCSMSCTPPPEEFDNKVFVHIHLGEEYENDVVMEPLYVSFICSGYFNKIFQHLFLGSESVETAIECITKTNEVKSN